MSILKEYQKDLLDQIEEGLAKVDFLIISLADPAEKNRRNRRIVQTRRALDAYRHKWITPLKEMVGT